MLSNEQITEIADTLECLSDELGARNWDPEVITAIMSTASGHLLGTALMRASVPQQQAHFAPPPPWPYGPDDFSIQSGVALNVQVTGRTKKELEDRARQHGEAFFGADADLVVTLGGSAAQTQPGYYPGQAGETQGYVCGATIREREPGSEPLR